MYRLFLADELGNHKLHVLDKVDACFLARKSEAPLKPTVMYNWFRKEVRGTSDRFLARKSEAPLKQQHHFQD